MFIPPSECSCRICDFLRVTVLFIRSFVLDACANPRATKWQRIGPNATMTQLRRRSDAHVHCNAGRLANVAALADELAHYMQSQRLEYSSINFSSDTFFACVSRAANARMHLYKSVPFLRIVTFIPRPTTVKTGALHILHFHRKNKMFGVIEKRTYEIERRKN